jgi:ABC-type oligopeptide transport system substrate-binding subunit
VLRGKDTQRIATFFNLRKEAFQDVRVRRAVLGYGIDRRAGNNAINHADPQVDALIDRMREAATEEAYLQAGYDFQRYVVENLMSTSVSSYGHLQAARISVQDYGNLHGYKLRFETSWLDKP